jgi:hypothetical protein
MTELEWRRLERQLATAHAEADPPLSPEVWRGVEAGLAARPARRWVWPALGVVVLIAAAVALWLVPGPGGSREAAPAVAPARAPEPAPTPSPTPAPAPTTPVLVPAPAPAPGIVLNQVIETRGPVTVVISSDAGRIEIEPCRGRFVNATVLDSPHHQLAMVERDRRIELRFDGRPVMTSGVAHVLVPADTHLVIATRSGPVVVRGLGGPIEIDSASGEIHVDTAPSADPSVVLTSDTGPIAWRGRCGRRCKVEATSRTGDIALHAPDPSVFTRGAVRGHSGSGRVQFEELTCTEPRCSSPPLPWRAAGPGH